MVAENSLFAPKTAPAAGLSGVTKAAFHCSAKQ
jgi:hypothetical protein